MANNNPSGVNGWQGFGTEEPYGQQTQDAQLAAAAPLAGGAVASGALAAGKKAQAAAQQPTTQQQPQPLQSAPLSSPPPPSLAQMWAEIAAAPGAENHPVLAQMAALAGGQG